MVFSPARLQSFRIRCGLSQADLALKSGLSRSYVSQLESGKRTGSPRSLHAVAKALEVEVTDLYDHARNLCPTCGAATITA